MRIDASLEYQAGPGRVAAMLADPQFGHARCEAMHAVACRAEVDGSPDGAFTVTVVRTISTAEFPDVARRFVGATVDVHQVDEWAAAAPDGTRRGTITVEITGAPVRMQGDQHLLPSGEGCVQRITGELRAAVPLVGRALEKAAEPAITSAIRVEERVGQEWLAAH